jgi:hypothetical protein
VTDRRSLLSDAHPALRAFLASNFQVYRDDAQFTIYRRNVPR